MQDIEVQPSAKLPLLQGCPTAAPAFAPRRLRAGLRRAVATTAASSTNLHGDSTRWWGEKTRGTSEHRGKR